ncbi:hypothetical protein [Leptospira harrisiae]|uniref:Uncharacterized protein n=1 Tax=Leptospira harrisiae TaxID=2023189 RepID=A0A2N0AIQ2_9LEPT|nr:hypothetical protein [Leptospira harrisiae]PJZ84196.1 hypothetical protein CH364_12755 [Leptospira harrisiae]PKA07889.1 hypothetical protein CH366_16205 [Leptospira harrisiae]
MTKKLIICLLFLTLQCQFQEKKTEIAFAETQVYDEWAGLSESDPLHKNEMDLSWKKLINTRDTITNYLKNKDYQPNVKTVVYPFSGIDVLNLFSFYPNAERYILFGLEDPGFPNQYDSLSEKEKQIVKQGIRNLSDHLAGRNYFTYRKMKEETKKKELNGAYPVFVAFLRRMGKEILDSKEETIEGKGINYKGFTISLYDTKLKKRESLTYFKIFLIGNEGTPGDCLSEYFSELRNVGIFTKSAEYLFHGEKRKLIRDLLLKNAEFVVQDESGFPIRFFPEDNWKRQVFGRYERSWNLSGAVTPEAQPELKYLSEATNDSPLPFPFGYGYLGTKDNRQSAVLVFSKK